MVKSPFVAFKSTPLPSSNLYTILCVKKRDEKQIVKNESGSSKCGKLKKEGMEYVKLKYKQSLNDNKRTEGRKKTCSRRAAFWVKQLNKLLVVLRS